MSMNRHEHFEELISASLAGDLTDLERRQLDAHLDSCAACRAILASFADQRRIMAGLRHIAPPRDLGARVRTGIAGGTFREVPWWRRPVVIFGGVGGGLAAVAGAVLAIVLLNGSPDDQVGVGSPSPSSVAVSLAPTAAPTAAPTPNAEEPSASPAATSAPEPEPEPDVYLAYTGAFDNLAMTLRDGRTGDTVRGLDTPGPPLAAQLSPNGQFLAYISELGQSGANEVWLIHLGAPWTLAPGATRVETPLAEWQSLRLGESVAGDPFLKHLSWSPDSQFLAYAVADTAGGTSVWMVDSATASPWRFAGGDASYVGSWVGPDQVWISIAGERPRSVLLSVVAGTEVDPLAASAPTLDGIFQPIVSPDGSKVIYWRGVMGPSGQGWFFAEGGAPYLAEARGFEFTDSRPLFSDVVIDRDAFTSAAIAWGADSDAYAVWAAQWTGTPQGAGGEYPNINRVYFGHASDARGLTEFHAIDEADIPQDTSVVDVKVPTGRHLLITTRHPVGGIMEAPRANLILVTRNTGLVADEVEFLPNEGAEGWFGPGGYDSYWVTTAP